MIMTANAALAVCAILAAGLLVGVETAVAAIMHPTIAALDEKTHTAAARELAKKLGAVMPFWYALALVLTAWEAALHPPLSETPGIFLLVSGLLWIGAIGYTVIALLPINMRVARWDLAALPGNWRAERARWDRRHRIRTLAIGVALVCLIVGLLQAGWNT
jgi:uncharacterized membrane protein